MSNITLNKKQRGYKYTEEFGYVPNDWDIYNIIDKSTLKARIGWQGLTTAEYLQSGDYFLITGTDFCNGKIDWQCCNYVDKSRYEQDKNIQIQNDDVLITKDGTIGKVAYIDKMIKPATLNSGIFVVRPKNEAYNPKYLYYVLMSNIFTRFLKKLTAGSTIMHLYQKDFVSFNFPVPKDINEQEKIAEVLNDIDELIESTQKLIDKKKDLKTATIQKLLTPKDNWKTNKLKDVAIYRRGSFPQPYGLEIWYDEANGMPFIQVYDIDDNFRIKTTTKRKISKIAQPMSVFIPKGSIILTIQGSIGRIAITQYDAFLDRTLLYFEKLIGNFDKNFFAYVVYELFRIEKEKAPGGIIKTITKDALSNFEISYPENIKEQQQIAQILSDMDSEIETLEKELNKYKDLKTGMMQDLLTGKIRIVESKQEKSKVISITEAKPKTKANDEFKDAVLISMLAYKFGSNKYPLGAFRRQKLSYLFKRHCNIPIDEYEKKAMGPYNPKMKYQGGEGIALRNKYVSKIGSRGLIATKNIDKAKEYFDRYYLEDSLTWLEQKFKYTSNNDLEVLATVDFAIADLKSQNKDITLENIKSYISNDEEWKPKLDKNFFNDKAILKAMATSKTLFSSY